jgi:hypothetical protein
MTKGYTHIRPVLYAMLTVEEPWATVMPLEGRPHSVESAENCNYDSVSVTCAVSLDEEGLTTTFASAVALTELLSEDSIVLAPPVVEAEVVKVAPPVEAAVEADTGTGTEKAAPTTGASVSASTAASTGGATLTTSASTGWWQQHCCYRRTR